MTPSQSLVVGRDVVPGQVIKIDGRWSRIVQWELEDLTSSDDRDYRWALVADPGHDPRGVELGKHVGRSITGRLRMVDNEREYPTRVQAAPEWEWVTRRIEREGR